MFRFVTFFSVITLVLWPVTSVWAETDAERKTLDKILARYVCADGHRVLASGAFWKATDEMHTELSQHWDRYCKRNTTAKDVAEVIARLKIDNNGVRKG